ncbi:putative uroporphyrinogen-III C-methyltransferase [Rubrivivax gelatinosus IL144]|uniref:Putative uroporphyrinogen-III C-methyltransferase n=1 Tax=Rubrivivax gelatinosus (strain NBRC 100245 / IL144) TaxID=983917 RepID=I0HVE7_RUBGI|nr:putative uroporphyrinogen-III C-methyltransferase [Rubrivivax gelatinosus IL144]
MTEPVSPPLPEPAPPAPSPVPAAPPAVAAAPLLPARWIATGAAVLAAAATAAGVLAWNTQQRVKALETELVKRQQDAGAEAAEARVAARAAQDVARDAAAKLAVLEARVAESTIQRSQFEEVIQSIARSRDENVLADVENSLRVAMQQTAITGSAEPLLITLKQADERLARYKEPRLERVRRALAQDLDRTRAAGVADLALLAIRLDEAVRAVDELPLLASVERRRGAASKPAAAAAAQAAPASSASSVDVGDASVPWSERWKLVAGAVWQEVRSLVRVTRIEQPEAMLVAPEQAWFLRENLKLRLLNARLALMSRQFDTAQSDLRDALSVLDRYFDPQSRRVTTAIELVRQVQSQARVATVPRPDATLAAIATVSAGR